MILLPRGNPVKENVHPGRIELPAAMEKLRQGRFSGYLRFDFPDGAGVLVYQTGRLIGARFASASRELAAEAAMTQIFAGAPAAHARLGIYRLAPEMAAHLDGLLQGEVSQRGQYLRLIDAAALLAQLREERHTGCLRLYARERVALIFYRDGQPLGFFHDGSMEIETTVDLTQSVAREPGAKLDVVTISRPPAGAAADLLATVDAAELWERSVEAWRRGASAEERAAHSGARLAGDRRQQAFILFQIAARQHLGRAGVALVEREFARLDAVTLGATELSAFFDGVAAASRELAEPDQIGRMLAEMRRGARHLASGR